MGVLKVNVLETFPGLEGCMAAKEIVQGADCEVLVVVLDEARAPADEVETEGEEGVLEEPEDEDNEVAGGDEAMAIREDIASIGSSSGYVCQLI